MLTFHIQQHNISSGSKSQILDMSKAVQTPEAFIKWPLLNEPMSAMKAFKSPYSLNLWCHSEEAHVTIQNVRLEKWYLKVKI